MSIIKGSSQAMATWSSITGNLAKSKKDDSNVVNGMTFDIFSFLSWSICNLKIGMMRIKTTMKTIACF